MLPYEIVRVEEETEKELMARFRGERRGFVRVGPQRWLLPASYADHAHHYYDFPLRPDDVWIVTYPRTGTTVTQELVWMLNSNFDYEGSKNQTLVERFPFIEFHMLMAEGLMDELSEQNADKEWAVQHLDYLRTPGYQTLAKMASPRHIKTHLPFSLLPPTLTDTCKVVYTARNPRDVAESFYHHNKLIRFHDYVGDWPQYWEYFKKDLLLWCPYWEHVKEGWERRHLPNVFFLFYEDLIKDLSGTIRKLADFLGKAVTEEQVEGLAKHLQINNFREKVHFIKDVPGLMNDDPKKFIRKGQFGKTELFCPKLLKEVEQWMEENEKKIGIKFPK